MESRNGKNAWPLVLHGCVVAGEQAGLMVVSMASDGRRKKAFYIMLGNAGVLIDDAKDKPARPDIFLVGFLLSA